MIKYVDAMQKSKSVAREWRQSDYFAIFVWVSKQFASAAGEIINFLVFLAKRLLLMVNIQFDGTANIVWKMSQKMFSLPRTKVQKLKSSELKMTRCFKILCRHSIATISFLCPVIAFTHLFIGSN